MIRSLTTMFVVAFVLICVRAEAQAPHVYHVTGAVAYTHDPSIIREGKTWYVFATGKAPEGGQLPIRCSTNLIDWKFCGQVFPGIPAWIRKRSPGTEALWAPDISHEDHEYRLYYAYSLFGKNTSGIALAVNRTLDSASPEYRWVNKGLVLQSTVKDDYNAIDPNFVRDRKGRSWLVFGSFWSGIKLRRLNKEGLVSKEHTKLYSLARRAEPAHPAPAPKGLPPNWEAIEAPFIVWHGGYYYLFTSWDLCCRGIHSTYRTMVGRSRAITGPYVDKTGKPLLDGGGSELLVGNSRWLGPGGESVWMGRHGKALIIFHAYSAKTGRPSMQLSTLVWVDGWPEAALEK